MKLSTMQPFIQRALSFLGSRLARNIYFWVVMFLLKRTDLDDQFAYSNGFYYTVMIFLLLFFVLLNYVNNFILVPRLLVKNKWVKFSVSALALTFLVAFTYTWTLKLMQVYIPNIHISSLSIITDQVTNDLSLAGIFADLPTFFFAMSIWVLIFTFLGYSNDAMLRVKRMQEIIDRHRETELAFLKSQINPHFLFNTLNNLYSLSLKKSDETPEAILQLSSVLRYILYDSNVERVPFEKEKEVMQAYIDIELLRLPQTADIQFSIMADRPQSIPPLLWLPVLENVFKHSRSTEEQSIDFRFSIHGNRLTIYSKNSISAIPPKDPSAGGIGLSNLRKRLKLLFPEKHLITVTSERNCFIIEVQITLD